jgi:hypothetical protein
MGPVLLLDFLSIHTSTLALTHVLLDLAANSPSYIEELRAEIETGLQAHDGKWNNRTLWDMPKLDSVFRESQRMSVDRLTKDRYSSGWHHDTVRPISPLWHLPCYPGISGIA